jgi:HK97 family phage major capsid protein/HK97 family phage prohead protease
MNRAYAILKIKSIDEESRVITGIATTPTPDRSGDIVEPSGAQFQLPIPLLWQHNSREPIGEVFAATITAEGIEIQARLATVDEAGKLKDRLDEAWQSIKAKLVRGLSIGFKPIEEAQISETYSYRYIKWLWLELSAVTIPANADATIHAIKSIDQAATGRPLPGAAGPLPVVRAQKDAPPMKTLQEQIAAFEATRAAKQARLTELMTKAAETGVTLDAAQTEEYDTLAAEVKSVDAHLVRLHELEKTSVATATRIVPVTEVEKAAALRGGGHVPIVTVNPNGNLPKGIAFTRMCIAIARGRGDSYQTLQHAKAYKDSTPEVEQMIEFMWNAKAAVAPGTTTDATWAGPLAVRQPIAEFLELLRPRTLLGQIPGLKHVPFNISVPSQTSGGTYAWVGQGLAKPVSSAAYAAVTLDFAKAAGIIVLSKELVKLSTPSAEGLVRDELVEGMSQFLDLQFVDPAVAAVANVNPASITNGASTAAASGVTSAAARLDLAASVAVFTAANIPLTGSAWLMSDSNAFGIGLSVNALGQPLFPGMSITGGSIFGIPVIVSNNVGNRVILVHAPSILFADEGGVQIDVSEQASVQMDSAPDSPATATTVLVSLWQNNLVGLRAERMITWKRARTAAVRYITAAAYVGT